MSGALKVIAVATLFSACVNLNDSKTLLNNAWELEGINGRQIDLGSQKKPMLAFNVDTMKVSGTDGCNRLSGGIEALDQQNLRFGMMASTRMMCPDMTVPDEFTKALSEVRRYKADSEKLILLDASGEKRLFFKKIDV